MNFALIGRFLGKLGVIELLCIVFCSLEINGTGKRIRTDKQQKEYQTALSDG